MEEGHRFRNTLALLAMQVLALRLHRRLLHCRFQARHPDGSLHHQQINSSPEAITNWLFELHSVSAEGRAAVAVEQRRGPLFH